MFLDKIFEKFKNQISNFLIKKFFIFFVKNLLPSIGERVKATNDDTTIEKDRAIAVSLNKVPEIPSIKINGKNTAIKIKVVAIIAKVICLDPLYAAAKGVSPFSTLLYIASVIITESSVIIPITSIKLKAQIYLLIVQKYKFPKRKQLDLQAKQLQEQSQLF